MSYRAAHVSQVSVRYAAGSAANLTEANAFIRAISNERVVFAPRRESRGGNMCERTNERAGEIIGTRRDAD